MKREAVDLDLLPMYPESFGSLNEVLNFLKVDKYKDGRPFCIRCWNYDNDNIWPILWGVYLGIVVVDEDSNGRLFTYIVKERYISTTFYLSQTDWEKIESTNNELTNKFDKLKKEFISL